MQVKFIRVRRSFCDFVMKNTLCRGILCTANCPSVRKVQDYQMIKIPDPIDEPTGEPEVLTEELREEIERM